MVYQVRQRIRIQYSTVLYGTGTYTVPGTVLYRTDSQ